MRRNLGLLDVEVEAGWAGRRWAMVEGVERSGGEEDGEELGRGGEAGGVGVVAMVSGVGGVSESWLLSEAMS